MKDLVFSIWFGGTCMAGTRVRWNCGGGLGVEKALFVCSELGIGFVHYTPF